MATDISMVDRVFGVILTSDLKTTGILVSQLDLKDDAVHSLQKYVIN